MLKIIEVMRAFFFVLSIRSLRVSSMMVFYFSFLGHFLASRLHSLYPFYKDMTLLYIS